MKKGFIVSIDVTLAIIILSSIFVIILNLTEAANEDVWIENGFHKIAIDTITVIDREGTLDKVAKMSESAGEDLLLQRLDDLLPSTFAANITFIIYTDADSNGIFEERSSNPVYSVKTPSGWVEEEVVVAKRIYADFDIDDITNNEYGIATIKLWVI